MTAILTQKTIEVNVSWEEIIRYLLLTGWTESAKQYRSPHGGEVGISLIDGESRAIKNIASIERRDTYAVCCDVLSHHRNR